MGANGDLYVSDGEVNLVGSQEEGGPDKGQAHLTHEGIG